MRQLVTGSAPGFLNNLSHRETFIGIVNGWLEQVRPLSMAEFLMQFFPSLYGARNGYGMDPFLRHIAIALGMQEVDR